MAPMTNYYPKRQGGGCAVITGIALLVLTVAWPLFVFHRHWTTTRLINCATHHADQGIARGCAFNSTTGNYSGTGIVTVTHSTISATGWLAEVIWLAFLVAIIVIFLLRSGRMLRQHRAEQGSARTS